jgi:hypothetical protein
MDGQRSVSERLRVAIELFDLSEAMLRQKLRREHPKASSAEIDAKVAEWIERRPGTERGNAAGRPIRWPTA